MKELIKRARHYVKRYKEPPYGREIEGTPELLTEMADKLEVYQKIEEQLGVKLENVRTCLPIRLRDTVYIIVKDDDTGQYQIESGKIYEIAVYEYGTFFKCEDRKGFSVEEVGRTVFLDEQQAIEATMKGGEQHDDTV